MKIKLIDKSSKDKFSKDVNKKGLQLAKKWLVKNESKLLKMGFKKAEFDTIAGFHFRGKRKGKFVQITTMHLLRLLKK